MDRWLSGSWPLWVRKFPFLELAELHAILQAISSMRPDSPALPKYRQLYATPLGGMYNCGRVGGGVAMSDTGSVVREWQSRFEGHLLTSTDRTYETSRRIWNGMIDRKPSLIARCASRADVGLAVKLARAEKMQVSVRGGGARSSRKRCERWRPHDRSFPAEGNSR